MTTNPDQPQGGTETRQPDWTPPGPGSWIVDRSHSTAGPSPVYRRMVSEHTAKVYRQVFEDSGAPVDTVDMRFVNGTMFRRLVPLIAPDRDKGKVPPKAVLWLVGRLHPEMRRRNRTALRVVENREYLDHIDHWMTTERHEWIEINHALQAIDPASLSDDELADHLNTLDERLVAGWYRHHQLHSHDLGPIGDLLVHTNEWGLDPVEVMRLLKGASPATIEAARYGAAVADALQAAGVDPVTITDRSQIDAVPAASAALDEYLRWFGWRLVSDYDICGLTLNELPSAIVAIVGRSATAEAGDGASDAEAEESRLALRKQAADPELFDRLLSDARRAYGVRDDNGPLTWSWPSGLTRRAYLEAGKRLAEAGTINTADHVFEADIHEVRALLTTDAVGGALTAEELVARAEHRQWEKSLTSPDLLGPPAADADPSPLPSGLRRLLRITLAAITMLDPEDEPGEANESLTGLGIGNEAYQGTARVAHDAGEAIAALEPGDILVAAYTAPSFNAVFAIAGGVVVQEGGLLCHAAVMARELGIPAVIGCRDAMDQVKDGDHIEVDPVSGVVRVLNPA